MPTATEENADLDLMPKMEEKKIVFPSPEIEISNWMCWELPAQAFIDTSKIIQKEERDA